MIVLFTDFGLEGPYTGQVKAVLYRTTPGVPVVDSEADRTKMNVVPHPSEKHPIYAVNTHEPLADWPSKQAHVWN